MKKIKEIAIASDHGGFLLKAKIIDHLKEKGYKIKNFGVDTSDSVDYPVYAKKVGNYIKDKTDDYLGIVVCGSGIGISIAANKVENIVCALIYSKEVANLARQHNNANVIAFGERTMDHKMVLEAIDIFLNAEFMGNQHTRRVAMLKS